MRRHIKIYLTVYFISESLRSVDCFAIGLCQVPRPHTPTFFNTINIQSHVQQAKNLINLRILISIVFFIHYYFFLEIFSVDFSPKKSDE